MSLETMAFLRFQINCKIKQAYQKAILQLSEHEGEVDLVFIQTPFLLLSGAPNENIVQNHLNIALSNVF